jgi:hypothetical protein
MRGEPMRRMTHVGHVSLRVAAAALVATVVAGCFANGQAGDFTGRGTIRGSLWCLAVQLETGDAAGRFYAVGSWPQGYSAKRIPGADPNGVLVDSNGATVPREGDTVDVRLHVVTASGDTPCANTAVATVVDFTRVPSPSR